MKLYQAILIAELTREKVARSNRIICLSAVLYKKKDEAGVGLLPAAAGVAQELEIFEVPSTKEASR